MRPKVTSRDEPATNGSREFDARDREFDGQDPEFDVQATPGSEVCGPAADTSSIL
jgi:hypothetical protein